MDLCQPKKNGVQVLETGFQIAKSLYTFCKKCPWKVNVYERALLHPKCFKNFEKRELSWKVFEKNGL